MKYFMLLVLIGLVAADVTKEDLEAVLEEKGSEKFAEYFTNTGYDYKFKTSNKIVKEEINDIEKGIVTGSYEYVSPEGRLIKVTYTAGAGIGFNPISDAETIHPKLIEAVELNLKNPPETPK